MLGFRERNAGCGGCERRAVLAGGVGHAGLDRSGGAIGRDGMRGGLSFGDYWEGTDDRLAVLVP